VHGDNAALYQGDYLTRAATTLRPGGLLAVWSADPGEGLAAALATSCGTCEEVRLPVRRGRHRFEYAIYLGRKAS
jgi:hypothetical protein